MPIGGRWQGDRLARLLERAEAGIDVAVTAYLNGKLDEASGLLDNAVRELGRARRHASDDDHLRWAFRLGLFYRSEVRHQVAVRLGRHGRTREQRALARAGLEDARRAVDLSDEGAPRVRPEQFREPLVLMSMAELSAMAGRPEDARRYGQQALTDARREATAHPGSDIAAVDLAHALMRRADLEVSGDLSQSVALRRASVALTRAHVRVDDPSSVQAAWSDGVWASTPTVGRFSASAYDLAGALGPPRAEAAREALLALQDAIEGFGFLCSRRPSSARPLAPHEKAFAVSTRAILLWLAAVDGQELATGYVRALVDHAATPTLTFERCTGLRDALVPFVEDNTRDGPPCAVVLSEAPLALRADVEPGVARA